MTRLWKTGISAAILALLAACGGDDDDPAGTPTGATPSAGARQFTTDFKQGMDGWVAGTSDYTAETAPTEVVAEQRSTASLGLGLAPDSKALFLSARNNSDDAFMYVRKQLTGLVANTSYSVAYSVNLLSNAPTGCMGVGGAPGESVWVVAGASPAEPKAVTENGTTKFSVDKGNQAGAGATSVILGTLANGQPCIQNPPYAAKLYRYVTGPTVKADGEGKVWVYVGVDSGFEATTGVYLQSVTTYFTPVTAT